MASARAERLALNEATFRVANERMSSWEERHQDDSSSERYFCECADPECQDGVRLDRREYEAVRSDSRHFVLAVGHADLSVERVIRSTPSYEVVEKNEDVRPLVEGTDPRND